MQIVLAGPGISMAKTPQPRTRDRDDCGMLTEKLRLTMATAGHDLRQPLQIIVGAFERLGRLAKDEADQMWLKAGLRQIARLSEGLEDLTDAARRPRSKADGPCHRLVTIGPILESVADEFRPAAVARGIRLRVVDCRLSVSTDPEVLVAALRNLVANAIKYTKSGGVVLGCRRRGDTLRIDVVDSGFGIAPADLKTIFEAYHQVDATADGIGLGLYLVHSHCLALGHLLDCESRVGAGSRFSIGIAETVRQS